MQKHVLTLIVYFLLFGFAIPWYWPRDTQLILFGVPGWVTTSILFSVLISLFTAWNLTQKWTKADMTQSPPVGKNTKSLTSQEDIPPGWHDKNSP